MAPVVDVDALPAVTAADAASVVVGMHAVVSDAFAAAVGVHGAVTAAVDALVVADVTVVEDSVVDVVHGTVIAVA